VKSGFLIIVPIYAKVSIFIHHSSNSKIKEKNKGSSNALLYNQIEDRVIYKQWSLTQISGVLKRYYPKQKDKQVSHFLTENINSVVS
jgi:hypothetical protein